MALVEAEPTQTKTRDAQLPNKKPLDPRPETSPFMDLSERFQGLDPNEISRAELDELFDLRKLQKKYRQERRDEIETSREQYTGTSQLRPMKASTGLSPEDSARLHVLNTKLRVASISKKYRDLDPNILSQDEIEELVAIEREQMMKFAHNQSTFDAWRKQDPATRGPRPEPDIELITALNPRLQELQGKINNAKEIEQLKIRIEKVSATHNISISENEITELVELQIEEQKHRAEFNQMILEIERQGLVNFDENPQKAMAKMFEAIPKHTILRMMEVDERMNAIKAPIEAAEKADRIRSLMAKLSQDSGVPVLSGEISESISLRAEKDKINSRTQSDAMKKWLLEGGPMIMGQHLPNDADYARLKEIDARLTAISAPMKEAKNALLEAENPALRRQRLERERQQIWKDDWQDKKQAGDVPANARLNSPSYAELQDRVKGYKSKLKSRAEKAGYDIPKEDLRRLDDLNDDLLSIRKKVHDMEVNGTSMVSVGKQFWRQNFRVEAGMYKVRAIEAKQRKILAGLSNAERSGDEPAKKETDSYSGRGALNVPRQFGAEAFIENMRKSGIEVPQSQADDLIKFEEALSAK